jgi:hypothetical protein
VRFSDPQAGALQRDTRDVAAAGAKTSLVNLEMGAGELNVQPAALAGSVMRATLTHSSSAGDVRAAYVVRDGVGQLTLSQPRGDEVIYLRSFRNTWDVQLSDALTERLNVAMGAGQSSLKLGGLPLRHAQISTGAGNVLVDLTGIWENDATIDISTGMGRLEVRLPDETGVEVMVNGHMGVLNTPGLTKVESGIYRNPAYHSSAITLHVNVAAGLGELVLAVAR